VDEPARLAPPELQRRLAPEPGERVRVDAGRAGLGAGERGEGRDPDVRQVLDLAAVEAGDAAEVVDLVPPGVAERLELADPAVVDRVGLRRRPGGDERLE